MGRSGLSSQEGDPAPQHWDPSLERSLHRSQATDMRFRIIRLFHHEPLTSYHRLQSSHRLVIHMAHIAPKKDVARLERLQEMPPMRSPQAKPPSLFQDPERLGKHSLRVFRVKVLDQIRTNHQIEALRLQARVSGIRTEEG